MDCHLGELSWVELSTLHVEIVTVASCHIRLSLPIWRWKRQESTVSATEIKNCHTYQKKAANPFVTQFMKVKKHIFLQWN